MRSKQLADPATDSMLPEQSWGELLHALFVASQSQDPGQRESAFRIFATTPAIIEKLTVANRYFDDNLTLTVGSTIVGAVAKVLVMYG